MTKVLFFGKLSDDLGSRGLTLEPISNATINEIIKTLSERQNGDWLKLLSADNIITAVNKTIESDRDKILGEVVEIAFFPPVTGG